MSLPYENLAYLRKVRGPLQVVNKVDIACLTKQNIVIFLESPCKNIMDNSSRESE